MVDISYASFEKWLQTTDIKIELILQRNLLYSMWVMRQIGFTRKEVQEWSENFIKGVCSPPRENYIVMSLQEYEYWKSKEVKRKEK